MVEISNVYAIVSSKYLILTLYMLVNQNAKTWSCNRTCYQVQPQQYESIAFEENISDWSFIHIVVIPRIMEGPL